MNIPVRISTSQALHPNPQAPDNPCAPIPPPTTATPPLPQVILSHTPMRDLVPQLAEAPVLVSGRGDVLAVARGYGLGRVLHTRQLGRAMPAATPFSSYPPPGESRAGPGSQRHERAMKLGP